MLERDDPSKGMNDDESLQIFWKCYEYGDNLVNIFEFIDDQRSKSVRDITIPDPEVTEEFIDKHGSIVRSSRVQLSLLEQIQRELFMLRSTTLKGPIQHFASSLSPKQLLLRATSIKKIVTMHIKHSGQHI